jgi:metal-responsive CopG/Arc/MetJ family transcriptional regulator
MVGMAVNPEKTVRTLISLPRELAREIDDYRFAERIQTKAEAIRRLITLGLREAKKPPQE